MKTDRRGSLDSSVSFAWGRTRLGGCSLTIQLRLDWRAFAEISFVRWEKLGKIQKQFSITKFVRHTSAVCPRMKPIDHN